MKSTPKQCTVSGKPADPNAHSGAPTDEKHADGQYTDHFVLCAEDRAKGYVEPYRDRYTHVGPPGPEFPLRDPTDEERERWGDDIAKYEEYPRDGRSALGRIWSQEKLDKVGKGCGTVTTMPHACAETYAAQPGYYGSTFCCGCGGYFQVGRDGEFVWDTETMQRVGTRRA